MTPTTAATQERTTDARVTLPRGAAKDMATRADEGFFGPGKLSRDEEKVGGQAGLGREDL